MGETRDGASGGGEVSAPTSQRLDAGWLEAIVATAPNFHDADPYSEAKLAAYFKWALGYFWARGATEWSLVTPGLHGSGAGPGPGAVTA